MSEGSVLLILILLIGILTKNRILGGAAAFVLALQLPTLRPILLFSHRYGVFGLIFLTVAVLAPLVLRIGNGEIIALCFPLSVVAIVGGFYPRS